MCNWLFNTLLFLRCIQFSKQCKCICRGCTEWLWYLIILYNPLNEGGSDRLISRKLQRIYICYIITKPSNSERSAAGKGHLNAPQGICTTDRHPVTGLQTLFLILLSGHYPSLVLASHGSRNRLPDTGHFMHGRKTGEFFISDNLLNIKPHFL